MIKSVFNFATREANRILRCELKLQNGERKKEKKMIDSSDNERIPSNMKSMIDFLSNIDPFKEEELFSSILKTAMKMVKKAKNGAIFQIKDGILTVKASMGYGKLKVEKKMNVDLSSFDKMTHQCAIDEEWKEILQESLGRDFNSSVVCTLFSKENEKILLMLENRERGERFSMEDLELMNLYSKILTNILKMNRISEELLTERAIYKSIVERSHDAIIVFKDGKLLFTNEEAVKLVGYSKKELIEMSAWDLVHPNDRKRLITYAEKRKRNEKAPQEYKAALLTKNGKMKICHFNVKRISFNGMPALLASIRDISDEEKAKNKLELANLEIRNAYDKLEKLNLRFQNVTKLLAKMGISDMSEKEFLQQVLKSALQVVPVAKYGSISILEEKKWKFVAAIGHDIKKLEKLDLNRDYVFKTQGKGKIIQNIFEFDKRTIPSPLLQKLLDAVLKVKQTIIAPLDLSGEEEGFLAIDIPLESESFFSQEDVKTVENFSKIASAFYLLRRYSKAQEEMKDKITMVLIKGLEKYDPYTEGHSQRVALYSTNLAKKLGFKDKDIKRIWQESILHDIGKLFVPLSILNKEEKLTVEEFEEIKKHPIIGAQLIEEGAQLFDIAFAIRHHHERWDGRGYPDGLAAEEIPVDSRIMAICDAYDAMVSDRAYRKAKSREEALKEIKENAGKQFDPVMVKAFLELVEQIEVKS